MSEENIGQIYTDLLKKYIGKRVLIVSHSKRFRYIWKNLFDLEVDMQTEEMRKKYFIAPTQVVPLPLVQIQNELDKWIFSELYATMEQLDKEIQGYFIEGATKTLTGFIDKLTNRYLRRSRRRFRSEEVTQDKEQAYMTLYEVNRTYLLI